MCCATASLDFHALRTSARSLHVFAIALQPFKLTDFQKEMLIASASCTHVARLVMRPIVSELLHMVAGRSVKTGLIGAVIVSQWTWAATLLQSSNVAFKYGVSGPFWYAAGATIQVLLFAILAIHVKLKAPRAHTGVHLIAVPPAHCILQCNALCACLCGLASHCKDGSSRSISPFCAVFSCSNIVETRCPAGYLCTACVLRAPHILQASSMLVQCWRSFACAGASLHTWSSWSLPSPLTSSSLPCSSSVAQQ